MKHAILRYLILAGVVHVTLTTAIFLVGHYQLLPNTFDENGTGLTFAIDGASYQRVASNLADVLQTNGVGAWLYTKAPFHSRLYSLSFATFGRFLGHNILGAEPLNLLFYLAILSCIYFLGREIFNVRTGFVAATIVALWPSFLFHSTQLIRDPISIACFLSLVLLLTLLLSRDFAWRGSIALGVSGALIVTMFWLVRANMWNVLLVAVALTIVMLAARMIRARRLMTGNAITTLLIIVAVLLIPARLESTSLPGVRPPVTPLAIPSTSQPVTRESIWTRTIRELAGRRSGFRSYTSQASNIDRDVQFHSPGDIVRYIPRALVIGFFAPFPKMWVESGSYGRTGRLLSGAETLVMYFLYLAVAFCLWRDRRNLKMWFVFLIAAVGLLALGLVVVNAGALYRIRYVFWMMLIVIASRGFSRINADLIRVHPRKSAAST
jgi:4-amino-4-deoxy-L-arabinose transferase-like glycosyltransferase